MQGMLENQADRELREGREEGGGAGRRRFIRMANWVHAMEARAHAEAGQRPFHKQAQRARMCR